MSNLEKAYEMILRHISRDCEGCYSTLGPCSACEDDATDAATALANAGLLAEDLPKPSRGMGSGGAVWYLPGPVGDIRRMGEHIVVFGHDCQEKSFRLVLNEAEAVAIGRTILAAAKHKEGEE